MYTKFEYEIVYRLIREQMNMLNRIHELEREGNTHVVEYRWLKALAEDIDNKLDDVPDMAGKAYRSFNNRHYLEWNSIGIAQTHSENPTSNHRFYNGCLYFFENGKWRPANWLDDTDEL